MDNFILQSFRAEVRRQMERQMRIRNYICTAIFIITLVFLVYIVSKNYSVSKYFFS